MLPFLLWKLFVLLCVEQAVCLQCYRRVDFVSGLCEEELGETEENDCCQNSLYGYKETGGVCRSCGSPMWSQWSQWGACSVLCGEGVRQRSRKCFGGNRPECPDNNNNLQTLPCTATLCCPGVSGWGSWGPWGACSVQCGEGGVRGREQICPRAAETEACNTQDCPVHGAWSNWSKWGECSATCIQQQEDGDIVYPSRSRNRSCSNPTPSSDTLPPGISCPGDGIDVQNCSELPICPVDGEWGSWEAPGPCSVSCGEGLQLSFRRCDSPTPKYGGKLCSGQSTRITACQNTCPVHGDWSGWSVWGECSSSCIPPDGSSIRRRYRVCTSPAPSSVPPGNNCPGHTSEKENCNNLPPCPVDGVWSPWGPWSSCSVTCGVGQKLSIRKCDSPATKHDGKPCEGPERRSVICTTSTHCPVNGVWTDWTAWGKCASSRKLRCKPISGLQSRERYCRLRAHNGTDCSGNLSETQGCYDVSQCVVKGTWAGWSEWGLCRPSCGQRITRLRSRICQPDYSAYPATIGRSQQPAIFYGQPLAYCDPLPEGENKRESQPCLNVPPCPDGH